MSKFATEEQRENCVKSLNAIKTQNLSTKQAIKLAKARTKVENITALSLSILARFCTSFADYDQEFNSSVVTKNIKALVKCCDFKSAIQLKSLKEIDVYTIAITYNMLQRKSLTMSNFEKIATCCLDLSCDTLKATDLRLIRSANTADTQASSTSTLLKFFNLASYSEETRVTKLNIEDDRLISLFEGLSKSEVYQLTLAANRK